MHSHVPKPRRARFGQFELDVTTGELRKAGLRVRISGQPLRILEFLLARPGELVTRDQLRQDLWSDDTFVDFDRGLNTAVKRLRATLGDSADHPRFIETLPRRGYRLLVPVDWDDDELAETLAVGAVPPARRGRLGVLGGLVVAAATALVAWSLTAQPWTPADVPTSAPISGDPEVTDRYLKGRYHLGKGDERHFSRARQYFEEALALDASHASSLAGLADYYILTDSLDPPEAFWQARRHAARAIAIDERLPDAHASLAFVRYYGDWDWLGAEQAFRRALELDASHVRARRWYGLFLAAMSRFEEARHQVAQALALDPIAMANHDARAAVSFNAHRFEEAADIGRQMVDLDPNDVRGYEHIALSSVQLGDGAAALAAAETALRVSPGHPLMRMLHAMSLGRLGRHDEAIRVLADLQVMRPSAPLAGVLLAIAEVDLGQRDAALDTLERAYAARDAYMVLLDVSPWFDPLRDTPRFQHLHARLAFPAVSRSVGRR